MVPCVPDELELLDELDEFDELDELELVELEELDELEELVELDELEDEEEMEPAVRTRILASVPLSICVATSISKYPSLTEAVKGPVINPVSWPTCWYISTFSKTR